MSGAAKGGAEHLARIHGTEEDKVCYELRESQRGKEGLGGAYLGRRG